MAVSIASAADRAHLITYLSTPVAATPAAPTVATTAKVTGPTQSDLDAASPQRLALRLA